MMVPEIRTLPRPGILTKLNRSFVHPHPALHVFLSWFQQEHYSQQRRIGQLQRAANVPYLASRLVASISVGCQHLGWLQNQPLDPFGRNNLLDDEIMLYLHFISGFYCDSDLIS